MVDCKRFLETVHYDRYLSPYCREPHYFSEFLECIHDKKDERLLEIAIMPRETFRVNKRTGETLLHVAARFGSVQLANQLIQLGLGVNIKDKDGRTPFYQATQRSVEMVKLFLDYGANITISDNKEVRIIQRALLSGSMEVVLLLMENQFSRIWNPKKEETPRNDFEKCRKIVKFFEDYKRYEICLNWKGYQTLLHFIGKFGDAETFKRVLSSRLDNINTTSPDGHTLLHVLVDADKLDFARDIMNLGADVNALGFNGYSALHYAIMRNNPKMVRLLLDHGAVVDSIFLPEKAPVVYALRFGNVEIVGMLLNGSGDVNRCRWNGITLMLDACGSNIFELMDIQTSQFELNYLNRDALMSWSGSSLEIVKLLIERGAKLNTENSRELPPILAACRAGRLDIVKLLLESGVKINPEDYSANDLLCEAVSGNNIELVQFLLRNGLDIRTREESRSLIRDSLASEQYHGGNVKIEMIEFIVDNGADVNFRKLRSNDPNLLQYAYLKCSSEFMVGLLELKARLKFPSGDLPFSPFSTWTAINSKNLKQFVAFLALKGEDISQHKYYEDPDNAAEICSMVKPFYQTCQLEIQKMKCMRICDGRRVTFFDFLNMELLDVVPFTRIEELMQVLENHSNLKDYFHCYSFMLMERIKRVKKLRTYVDLIEKFLQKEYAEQNLPMVVFSEIFRFWKVAEVRNFGRALSG